MASKFRTRKLRHQHKQALKFGKKAKPTHRAKSGRTGMVFCKQLQGRLKEAEGAVK